MLDRISGAESLSKRETKAGAGSGKLPLSLFALHEGEATDRSFGKFRSFAGERGSGSLAPDQSFASDSGAEKGGSMREGKRSNGKRGELISLPLFVALYGEAPKLRERERSEQRSDLEKRKIAIMLRGKA